MSKEEFRTVVKALITNNGDVLIGQKEEDEDHPIGGEWHFLGGHLERGEQVEEAIKREVEEETGLEVDVHQVIDVMTFDWDDDGDKDALQILFHCESTKRNAKPREDLQDVKWVEPSEITENVHTEEAERLKNREDQAKFLAKLEKAPF
jgi:mutator protein MutT